MIGAPGAEPSLVSADPDFFLTLSPDGTLIAYLRRLAGQWEICLDVLTNSRGCQPVGFSGTARPSGLLWRADGRELIFRSGDDVMAAPVQTGATPVAGKAVRLFPARGTTGLAVTSKGDRFLVLEPRTEPPPTISVVVNWTPDRAQ
jgi:hypothetical protein